MTIRLGGSKIQADTARQRAVDELKKTVAVLAQDIEEIRAYGRKCPTPFAHRTLLRTHFALVESMTFLLKQVALASADYGLFTPAEIALLREKTYYLDNTGAARVRPKFQKLLPTILFTLRCYARIHGARFEPDTKAQGWRFMHGYQKVRNRLTHSKCSADLELSDSELLEVAEVASWFKTTLHSLFKACDEADTIYRATHGSK